MSRIWSNNESWTPELGVYFHVYIPLVFHRFIIKLLGQFLHTAKLILTPVHDFSPLIGLLGIAELTPDIFAVVAGNYSAKTSSPTVGSFSV